MSRQAYYDAREQLIQAQATVVAETGANKALKETMNWLMLRVTALEKERAIYLDKFFGVKIAVPELSPAIVPDPFASHPLNDSFSFNGLSDEEARLQGIEHDSDGRLQYTR